MMLRSWPAPLGLHIEPGAAARRRAVAELHAKGFYPRLAARGFRRLSRAIRDTPTLVACDGKRRIAGFAMLRLARRRRRVDDHRRRPQIARQGLGRALMKATASRI